MVQSLCGSVARCSLDLARQDCSIRLSACHVLALDEHGWQCRRYGLPEPSDGDCSRRGGSHTVAANLHAKYSPEKCGKNVGFEADS